MKSFFSKKYFIWLLLTLMAIPLFFSSTSNEKALALKNFLDHHEVFFLVWRIALLIIFLAVWPIWIRNYAKKNEWDEQHTKKMVDKRWTFAFWLIIIDLVMVENILFRLF